MRNGVRHVGLQFNLKPFEILYITDISGTPILGRGDCRLSAIVPFERVTVVSIVTIALSTTIWPQFAMECVRRSNQQGVGYFGSKFLGVHRLPFGIDP